MPDNHTVSDGPSSGVACAAIIVAGGEGRRYGGLKQYGDLRGSRVLDYSIVAARAVCDLVVLVVPARLVSRPEPDVDVVVAGGATRSQSVRAGLEVIPDDCAVVVVHDAVRPLAGVDLFTQVVATVRGGADGAVPGVAVVDTLRRRDGRELGVGRDELVAVQTPQAFKTPVLRRAHDADDAEATDDASLVSAAGGTIVVVPGSRTNLKITEAVDLLVAEVLATGSARSVATGRARSEDAPDQEVRR
jgi:2-C-methyl-D-erythritol 4-phosphate cytidylyltransferase